MSIIRILKKFRLILSRHQKVRIIELAVLMIIGGFMEMLSVALILPFAEAVANPRDVAAKPYVKIICQILHLDNYRDFLVFLAVLMAFVYIVKNAFFVFQMGIQNRFVWNNMFAIQQRLLRSYLSRPYEYYLGINSGEILRIIENDTSEAFYLLTFLLGLFSEAAVSVILVSTIFLISPGVTLGMAVMLLGIVMVILKVIRPVLRQSGIANQAAYANMKQWLLQAIQGIKELKIMRKEQFFEDNFEKSGNVYVKTLYKSGVLSLIPKFTIEAAAMSAFFLTVAFMIYSGTQLESLVPILSGIAVAAIRLLPAANRISYNMANISFREPMLDKLMESLNDIYDSDKGGWQENSGGLITSGFLEASLHDVSYCYPKGKEKILDMANMTIRRGQSVGIIGASGAGKTTMVDVFLGLLQPQNGKVFVNGINIEEDMDGWLSKIGYIPQTIFILDGNVRENVAFGITEEQIDDEAVWKALKEAALDEFVHSQPEGLSTPLGERGIRLSGGQRQRIGIARALYNNPEILFFDEATSALDHETETEIMHSIDRLHGYKTMIIIAHRLSTIENCDIIYRIQEGKVLEA